MLQFLQFDAGKFTLPWIGLQALFTVTLAANASLALILHTSWLDTGQCHLPGKHRMTSPPTQSRGHRQVHLPNHVVTGEGEKEAAGNKQLAHCKRIPHPHLAHVGLGTED
eukprot:1138167-Pelagomonas_calceolata.AAC.7